MDSDTTREQPNTVGKACPPYLLVHVGGLWVMALAGRGFQYTQHTRLGFHQPPRFLQRLIASVCRWQPKIWAKRT